MSSARTGRRETRRRGVLRFLRARSGTAAVEFAVVGPIFLFLALLIVEVGILSFAQSSFRNGVREAGRETLVGADRCASVAEIRAFICERSVALPDCETRLQVTRRSFAGGFTGAPGSNFGATTPGDAVLLQVFYPWPSLSPLVDVALADESGAVRLAQSVFIQTEAFAPGACS